jgi:hypothetical protein
MNVGAELRVISARVKKQLLRTPGLDSAPVSYPSYHFEMGTDALHRTSEHTGAALVSTQAHLHVRLNLSQ